MRISDWSSDVCSSDLLVQQRPVVRTRGPMQLLFNRCVQIDDITMRGQYAPTVGIVLRAATGRQHNAVAHRQVGNHLAFALAEAGFAFALEDIRDINARARFDLAIAVDELQSAKLRQTPADRGLAGTHRSEEHTSELQSLMRISYAVFCLKKKNKQKTN